MSDYRYVYRATYGIKTAEEIAIDVASHMKAHFGVAPWSYESFDVEAVTNSYGIRSVVGAKVEAIGVVFVDTPGEKLERTERRHRGRNR